MPSRIKLWNGDAFRVQENPAEVVKALNAMESDGFVLFTGSLGYSYRGDAGVAVSPNFVASIERNG